MNKLLKSFLVLGSIVATGIFASSIVLAITPDQTLEKRSQKIATDSSSAPTKIDRSDSVRKDLVKQKLTEESLNFCRKKQGNIEKRSEQLTKMALNMELKFNSIFERVQNFYTTKVLPSGKTVSNYETLVEDVEAKKALVDASLAKAESDLALFDCNGEDPKGKMMTFNEDMKAVKEALKVYRESIRNFIVAVHGQAGAKGLESPKPSGLQLQTEEKVKQ